MKNGVKCNISFEELENYRDKEGYINLDELNLEFTEESREKIGNENRIKNWVDFSGVEALIRGECKIDNKRNGGIYSELIVEELAKQAGLETAYYDLVKVKGEYGVLSKNILTHDNDDLITLQSLIGNTKFNEEYPEIIQNVEKKIKASLPEVVKSTATYVYEFRKKEIGKIIYPELGESSIGEVYSNEISNKSIDEGIRQGEEDEILRRIMHIYGIEERDNRKVTKN